MPASNTLQRALKRTLRGRTPTVCLTLSHGRPCLELGLKKDRSALYTAVFAMTAATLFVLCAVKRK